MAYIGNGFDSQVQVTTPVVDVFNGNGSATTFTLTRPVTSVFSVQAVVNNVPQNPQTAYSINSSNQIVFTSAPSAGSGNIYVRYNGVVGQRIGIGQGSVQPTSLSPGGPQWDVNGNLLVSGNLLNSITETIQTASYTIQLSDRGGVVAMNNTAAAVVTIPNDTTVFFPIGAVLYIARVGSGAVSLAAAGGVSVSKIGAFAPNEQIALRKRAANTWLVMDSNYTRAAIANTPAVAAGRNIHTYTSNGNFIV
jgi:hypothetical protein